MEDMNTLLNERNKEIIQKYISGDYSQNDLQRIYGISHQRISYILRRASLKGLVDLKKVKQMKRMKLGKLYYGTGEWIKKTSISDEDMQLLKTGGLSVREAAERYKLSETAIRNHL